MHMLKDFKEFVLRGNVVDMAVGIVIGAAFGAVIASLVGDIIMPPIGLLVGGIDFANLFILLKAGSPAGPYASLVDAQAAGAVTINYGAFIGVVITFLIIAFVMFMLIRSMNRMKRAEEVAPAGPATKECPYCLSTNRIKATRCAHCTSELPVA